MKKSPKKGCFMKYLFTLGQVKQPILENYFISLSFSLIIYEYIYTLFLLNFLLPIILFSNIVFLRELPLYHQLLHAFSDSLTILPSLIQVSVSI